MLGMKSADATIAAGPTTAAASLPRLTGEALRGVPKTQLTYIAADAEVGGQRAMRGVVADWGADIPDTPPMLLEARVSADGSTTDADDASILLADLRHAGTREASMALKQAWQAVDLDRYPKVTPPANDAAALPSVDEFYVRPSSDLNADEARVVPKSAERDIVARAEELAAAIRKHGSPFDISGPA